MKKIKEVCKRTLVFIKKHWFILSVILLCVLRFLFTYKLPSFYLKNMNYDDYLMIEQSSSLLKGKYLGLYGYKTLVKGPIFPFLLSLIRLCKLNYSCIFTILYIAVCLFFVNSFKNITKNKKLLLLVYVILLFNPVTYSQDLFQRLYRNSISITELLFFLGSIILILFSKKKKWYYFIFYGLSLSLMFLTREDNLWTYPVIGFILIYNFLKNKKIKTVILNLIPILLLVLSLNVVSFINYKNYGIYTYNELQKSEFHDTYKKILQIKDDEKKKQVSIPKSTLYKLSENCESLNISKNDIDFFYRLLADKTNEIYNGNMIWYFRYMVEYKNELKSGKESEKYYKKLGKEIDSLFEKGVFEKEFVMPSNSLAVPTKKDLLQMPKEILNTIIYTTTYKDIKTFKIYPNIKFNNSVKSYYFKYIDYHHTVNIVKRNDFKYEIFRIIYSSLTIVFSIVSLFIYFKNIKKFDNVSILCHILVICYCLIIGGTVYTHITSFHAIRPLYLGNIYIIQNIFILLNLSRINLSKKEN